MSESSLPSDVSKSIQLASKPGEAGTGHPATVSEKNSSLGNRRTISGSPTYRQTTLPRQSSTLHGAFYRSALYPLLERINAYLLRWVRRKYK